MYERCNIQSSNGRRLIGRIRKEKPIIRKAAGNAWDDKKCWGLDIQPEDATPERIARENEMAKKHNTGAVYDSEGRVHLSSRSVRAREMRRRGVMDNDAGYSDYAGR